MVFDTHIERYEFHCSSCDYTWQITYEVRDLGEVDHTHQYLYVTGVPATPPDAGRLCPNCWLPAYSPHMVDSPVLARGPR
jgi:hypothetical protein